MPDSAFDWDDLRFIIAVADQGSAVAAARRLGVNATTVQRRVSRFEQQNAIRLFERRQSGLSPTPECEALVDASRDIEERVSGIRLEILGRDLRLEGRLTVTTTDTFMYEAMAGHLSKFKQMHPDIIIDITLTNSRLNLSRHDADIAVRPSNNPPENLVGQRVSGLAFAIYAAPSVAAKLPKNPTLERLKTLPWIGTGEALKDSPAGLWMDEQIPSASIVMSVDTFPGVGTTVAAGLGLALMPCGLGDADDRMVRIGRPMSELDTSVWVLTHPEIRSAAKVRAFMDFITKALRSDSKSLEGRIDD